MIDPDAVTMPEWEGFNDVLHGARLAGTDRRALDVTGQLLQEIARGRLSGGDPNVIWMADRR